MRTETAVFRGDEPCPGGPALYARVRPRGVGLFPQSGVVELRGHTPANLPGTPGTPGLFRLEPSTVGFVLGVVGHPERAAYACVIEEVLAE